MNKNLLRNGLLGGIFYSIYGANDFVFMLFFLWAAFSQRRKTENA